MPEMAEVSLQCAGVALCGGIVVHVCPHMAHVTCHTHRKTSPPTPGDSDWLAALFSSAEHGAHGSGAQR